MQQGEDLHVHPPRVGGQGAGPGLVDQGVQGAEAAGFHPEANELDEIDEAKTKYKKNQNPKKNIKSNKIPKKYKNNENTQNNDDKVPLTLITVNANGLKKKVDSLRSIVKHFNAGTRPSKLSSTTYETCLSYV